MFERMSTVKVKFRRETRIAGVDQSIPAGTYDVETEEEMIPGLSFLAYRRVRTSIALPCTTGAHIGRQVVEINPEDLATALDRDADGPDEDPISHDRGLRQP